MLKTVSPTVYIFIIFMGLFIASCSLVEDAPPTGFYICQGPYKNMEFDNGTVTVDMGFIKKAGTYTTEGTKLNLTLDGKSLVFDSPSEPTLNLAPEDFNILTSRFIQCSSLRAAIDAVKYEMNTPEGKAHYSTGAGKADVDAVKKLAKKYGVDW
jgi:hypothetical protein